LALRNIVIEIEKNWIILIIGRSRDGEIQQAKEKRVEKKKGQEPFWQFRQDRSKWARANAMKRKPIAPHAFV